METRTFLIILLVFYNATSTNISTKDSKTEPGQHDAVPKTDNLTSYTNPAVGSETKNIVSSNLTSAATAGTNTTAVAAVARDCCCHKEEPHYCDKSCQAFVIFALLSILLFAFLQANPVPPRRRRRSLSSWHLALIGGGRSGAEWDSKWYSQVNQFSADVVERKELKRKLELS